MPLLINILELISIIIFFFPQMFKNLYNQYDVSGMKYDSHPYPIGWPDYKYNAEKVCKAYERRLCSNIDLKNFVHNQGRGYCTLSWAFFFEKNLVAGFMANSNKLNCIPDLKNAIGVFPDNVKKFGDTLFICFHNIEVKNQHYECSGNGSDYDGYISTTITGEECQMWDKQYPNQHPETPLKKEYSMLKSNYCRNPNNSNGPWCYLKNRKGKQFCNIKCSPFGKFDGCSVTIFDQEHLTGNKCTMNVNAASLLLKNLHQKTQCGNAFEHRIRSVQLRGNFCNLVLVLDIGYGRKRDYTYKGNQEFGWGIRQRFTSLLLYDTSAAIVIGDKHYFIIMKMYLRGQYPVHICNIDEIDHSVKIIKKNDRYSDVASVSENVYYTYEKVQLNGEKRSWCCADEHPTVSDNKMLYNEAESYCTSQVRISTFNVKGKTITYTRQKRLCTEADLMMHFHYRRKKCEEGFVLKSPDKIHLFKKNR